MSTTYYEVLGVPFDASEAAIRRAYKQLALKFHPDKNPAASAKQVFQQLSEAASVLLDPQKRAAYDMELSGGVSDGGLPASGASFPSGFGAPPPRGSAAFRGPAPSGPDFAREFFSSFFGGDPFGDDPFGADVAFPLAYPRPFGGSLLRGGSLFGDFFGGSDPFQRVAELAKAGGGGGATYFSSSSFSSCGGNAVQRSSRLLAGGVTETRTVHRRTHADGSVETLEDSVKYTDRSGREVPAPLAVQQQQQQQQQQPAPQALPAPPSGGLKPASAAFAPPPRTTRYDAGGSGGGYYGGGATGGSGYYASPSPSYGGGGGYSRRF